MSLPDPQKKSRTGPAEFPVRGDSESTANWGRTRAEPGPNQGRISNKKGFEMNKNFHSMQIFFGVALAGLLSLSTVFASASANELDSEAGVINEQALRSKDLPQTIVVRVNESTGEAAVLNLSARLAPSVANADMVVSKHSEEFKSVPVSGVSELDRNSSASSWYVWYDYSYWYAPTYYYWGYTYAYSHYYSSYWGGYSYYWYWYR